MFFFMACDDDVMPDSKTSQEDNPEIVEASELDALPHIYIDTHGEEIVDEPKIPSIFEI